MHLRKLIDIKSLILFFVLLTVSTPVYAEVMDKEPPISRILIWTTAAAILGFIFNKNYRWAPLFLIPFTMIHPLSNVFEINDPYVGPAIMNEAGIQYFTVVYLSFILVLFSNIFGIYLYYKKHLTNR